jgi:CheY-like chemotaxis protein
MAHDACRRSIVLVVEDEILVRWQATDIIQDAGFNVLEAANADEAIQILQSRTDIEVIFTDVQMPGSMDQARGRRSGSMAARKDHRDLRPLE